MDPALLERSDSELAHSKSTISMYFLLVNPWSDVNRNFPFFSLIELGSASGYFLLCLHSTFFKGCFVMIPGSS